MQKYLLEWYDSLIQKAERMGVASSYKMFNEAYSDIIMVPFAQGGQDSFVKQQARKRPLDEEERFAQLANRTPKRCPVNEVFKVPPPIFPGDIITSNLESKHQPDKDNE